VTLTDAPGFPFTPGSARVVGDPAAEAEKIAEARKAAEAVTIPLTDFAVLMWLARRGAGYLEMPPDGVMMSGAHAVLERYAGC
jgi:hypothetical protein